MLTPRGQQVRRLNLHEYQSMSIMEKYGVNIPPGIPADTPAEADKAYSKLRGDKDKDVVIKAMALTGGRGLGHFKNGFQGGVHMCTK